MRRLTLADVRTDLAEVIGCCTTDARIARYANEAQERLLNRPSDPVGSWMRYRICAGSSDCLVWPRQIRTIKTWWVCNQPGLVRSEWFEAIGYWEGGPGKLDSNSSIGNQLVDRGTVCSFDNIIATTAEPRKIQAVASDASDNGKTIHLRYIDSNGNRKYSSISGSIQEGENLTLSTSGVLTSSNVATNGLYHVIKATTNYPVRLYSYDTNSASQSTLLAVYEPSETNPIYRSTFVPGFTNFAACPDASSDCTVNKTLEVLAKLQHVPVISDNDPFVIGNLPALKDMVRGLVMWQRNEREMAAADFASAANELDGEIASYLGDGMTMQIRMSDYETWGAGGILNAV